MINIIPQSEVRLLKTVLEKDSEHTLTFDSLSEQTTYFLSKVENTFNDFTYVKEQQAVVVPKNYDEIYTCNYLMYKNTGFNNKYFYAFITKMEFVSENSTRIYFEIDSLQTWYFQINYKNVFVEREHVSDDIRGKHTIPENIEHGEYISQFVTDFSLGTSHIVMASNIDPSLLLPVGGNVYGNIFSGVKYYVFQGVDKLQTTLVSMASAGKIDAITSIFYCPDFITGYNTITFDSSGIAEVPNQQGVLTSLLIPLTPSDIDGYTPKNNKCFVYPYVSYVLSNNAGGSIEYKLEDFENSGNNLGEIKVRGTCTPGASIRAIPVNYKCKHTTLGNVDNNEYGLTAGKYPICSYPVDSYLNWQTQQSVNMGLEIAQTLIGTTANLSVGNYAGATSNALSIGNMIAEQYKHSLVPVQAKGNLNSGDITYTEGKLTFTGYLMTIKNEYIKVIDDYFQMYGYKVNEVKIPNIHSRQYFNYVKTIGCNFEGDIPQEDLQKIKDIFNKGITFWHNDKYYLDYSVNNVIIQ